LRTGCSGEYLNLTGRNCQEPGEDCIEELHNLYASPDIIRAIRSKILKCAGHEARTGEVRNV